MPTYTFQHKTTGEIIERVMKISEQKDWLDANPDFEIAHLGMTLGDPVRLGLRKPDAGFREVLQKAKAAHPRGNINTF